jgi:hypothetical protein
MARGILVAVRFRIIASIIVLAAVSLPAGAAEPKALNCSGLASLPASGLKEVQEFRRRVSTGPFFKELVRRTGQPSSCRVEVNGSNLTLIYIFRRKARLEARANVSIEYFQQRMQLQDLDEAQAMELLKKSERDAFGAQGCGINWQQPSEESPGPEPGTREVVYRGDNCNCQGRLVYRGNALVALVSSSAC